MRRGGSVRVTSRTPPWLVDMPRPWIVVDLNLIRARKALPTTGTIVIPDVLATEAATSENPDVALRVLEEELRKIGHRRILVARHWSELARAETPSRRAAPGEVIHPEISRTLSKLLSRPERLLELNAHTSEAIAEYRVRQQEFVSHSQNFTRWMQSDHQPALREMQSDAKNCLDFIRRPGIHRMFLARNNSRYASPDWRRALTVFPDTSAIGRWARIILWYAALHAAGKTYKFINNYDDAHYLFTASYVRRLATSDVRLVEAAKALFPQISIVS